MKFCDVNKSTILNRFVLHTLKRNITHLAVIARKTNIILGILKGGKLEKSQNLKVTKVFWLGNSNETFNEPRLVVFVFFSGKIICVFDHAQIDFSWFD